MEERMNVLWHFRTRWPEKCFDFDVFGDVRAAKTVFHSALPFVLFDTGTYLRAEMVETEKHLKPCGRLAEYLHD
ncbi:MAG: hypothetical protein HN341_16090 [Verrucomicrobia bacterium]|jgi:hypothetical protein|nr:hypothetical protein [Verrucomicrobiota bacterium]